MDPKATTNQISRVRLSSGTCLEEIQGHVRTNTPLVIDMNGAEFPFLGWNLDDIAKKATSSEHALRVSKDPRANTPLGTRAEFEEFKMPLSGIVKRFDDEDRHRLRAKNDITNEPRLMADMESFTKTIGFTTGRLAGINLWLNNGTCVSGLHYDQADNFNVQISGSKRFTVFRPGRRGTYPNSTLTGRANTSRVKDCYSYDRSRFPKFEKVFTSHLEVTLDPGEMLYIPQNWWHQVNTSGEQNINVNFWWASPSKLIRFPWQTTSMVFLRLHRMLRKGPY
jgi:hypothetical protein